MMVNYSTNHLPRSKESPKTKRPPKSKPINPVEEILHPWLLALPPSLLEEIQATIDSLISTAPKRWVVYPPMLLLPSGSFSSPSWKSLLSHFPPSQIQDLWTLLLHRISKKEGKGILTHLAVNAGIPLTKSEQDIEGENILRTPSGLLMLYGDFGPALQGDSRPSERDFEEAFWVSTKQNGIVQIWAPRYTMFSRGNVKEKARLLGFHDSPRAGEEEVGRLNERERRENTAVDFYAGIGYFVFSYVAMGMGKVVGWELNSWSVEGLRRGAAANGWEVKVVKRNEDVIVGDERIVVFLENNQMAGQRMEKLKNIGEVKHVNCGLLPTSEASWEMTLGILQGDGWLHLHENVGVHDVEGRKGAIEGMLRNWLEERKDSREVKVEHVEFVKTFAPGVWHCVFDVYIRSLL